MGVGYFGNGKDDGSFPLVRNMILREGKVNEMRKYGAKCRAASLKNQEGIPS